MSQFISEPRSHVTLVELIVYPAYKDLPLGPFVK